MQKRRACLILVWLALAGLAWGQEGELKMAMSGAFAPFSTIDEQGQLVGFDADIARALAAAMHRRPVLIQVDWSGIQAGLQSGKYDLICGSMAITPERLERMHFSLPYYVSGAQVFAFEQRPKRFGVTEDSTYARYIREHPQQFGRAEVVYYGSEAEILTAMRADKIDGFVSDRIVGGFYLARAGAPDIAPQGELLYQEACGIAARLEDAELVRQVNAALLELVQSGEYDAIYRRWVGSEPDLETLFRQWGAFSDHIPRDAQGRPSTSGQSQSGWGDTLTLLARGALLTVELSLLTACLSMLTGLGLGLGTVSPSPALERLSRGYVALVRGTPLLVQLFLSYFVVATTVNRLVGFELMGAFSAALLALVINTTAYNGETIRGGIQAVEAGQWDAAYSLGMTRAKTLRRVILPQALRSSIPSLGNNLVVLVKDTSLVGAITLIELTYAARNVVFQTGQAFGPFLLAAAFYLVIISGLSWAVRGWEKRLATP